MLMEESELEVAPSVVSLDDRRATDARLTGAKAAALATATRLRFPQPAHAEGGQDGEVPRHQHRDRPDHQPSKEFPHGDPPYLGASPLLVVETSRWRPRGGDLAVEDLLVEH